MEYRMVRTILIFLLVVTGTAHGQIVDSPRGKAMSGVRADPVGSSALIYNPAGLSRSYMYVVEAQYFRAGPGNQNALALNIIDSKAQPQLPVGLSYGFQFTDGDPEVSEKGHDVRLAFAHPAVPDHLHVGVGLRYLSIDRAGGGIKNLEGFTLDAGLLILLGNGLQLGVVGENLVDIDDPTIPRRAGGALAYAGQFIVLDVDVMMDFESHPDGAKPAISTGMEFLVGGSVPFRVGYIHDLAREDAWLSGGIGFMTGEQGQGGQLSLAYSHNLEHSEWFDFGLAITLFI